MQGNAAFMQALNITNDIINVSPQRLGLSLSHTCSVRIFYFISPPLSCQHCHLHPRKRRCTYTYPTNYWWCPKHQPLLACPLSPPSPSRSLAHSIDCHCLDSASPSRYSELASVGISYLPLSSPPLPAISGHHPIPCPHNHPSFSRLCHVSRGRPYRILSARA